MPFLNRQTAEVNILLNKIDALFNPVEIKSVADRTFLPGTYNNSIKETMSRTRHVACDDITSLKLVYSNWYMANGLATGTGGTATINASIEYPVGTIVRSLSGGNNAGTVISGNNQVRDETAINIPRGTEFFVRTHYSNPAGGIWANRAGGDANANFADVFTFGTTVDDLTGGGTIVSAGAPGLVYGPSSIIMQGAKNKSVFVFGDSRAFGLHDDIDTTLKAGIVQRAFPANVATCNAAQSGSLYQQYANDPTFNEKFLEIAQYYDYFALSAGINDINAGRTPAQVIADIKTLISRFPSTAKVILTTINPYTSSTDSWSTLANQTVGANEVNRVTLNNLIRAGGIHKVVHIADVADVVESARDSGKWIVNGSANFATQDGLHEKRAVILLIVNANKVVPNPF